MCLLGLPDARLADDSADATSAQVSRLGGAPVWLAGNGRPGNMTARPCGQCKAPMMQLVQVYAPLEQERVLHVWACNSKRCSGKPGSVLVVREQLRSKPKLEPVQRPVVDEWDTSAGATSADWSVPSFDAVPLFDAVPSPAASEQGDPLESLLLKQQAIKQTKTTAAAKKQQRSNNSTAPSYSHVAQKAVDAAKPKEPAVTEVVPDATSQTAPAKTFDCYYLNVVEESSEAVDKKARSYDHEAKLLAEYERIHGKVHGDLNTDGDDGGDDDGKGRGVDTPHEKFLPEKYEKTSFGSAEKTLVKFQQTVAVTPSQCLRYASSTDDAPLKYTSQAEHNPSSARLPRCEHCGAQRVFEMQLMPALLTVLQVDRPEFATCAEQPAEDIGLEYGTVLVYSCEQSCQPPGIGADRDQASFMCTEVAVVQPML